MQAAGGRARDLEPALPVIKVLLAANFDALPNCPAVCVGTPRIDGQFAGKSQVSSGDRSAKIRTYNYPQSRVTDHRIEYTAHNLPAIMNGDLQEIIDALQLADRTEKLKEGMAS